ncbi:hypothetical protein HS088_TW05G00500 [Tripterygium wilfordii]|uniref:Uncharacterized protein n=1 Tax=Tripterygium wilfordii TaxID=458696 RepID=A0A7J7DNA8_TRIWF|nr:uncharacterized protein LOC119998284 isoform X1 [Tripterygium wilfordii]KAF5747773.1 hypothetical protein HS088_TW05G00500 [Tripterygium wilfordii]
MSRRCLLVVLLLLIVFTSQFEWNQQFGNEIEATPIVSRREQYSSKREETVKEKLIWLPTSLQIILSQEKKIHKLNELMRNLQQQLLECRNQIYVVNVTAIPLTEHLTEVQHQPILED